MSETTRTILQRLRPDYPLPARHCGRVYTDTSDFCRICYGDVIALGGQHFLVIRDEAERRFGLEDPKFWVKRCVCLETGQTKILKLVFHENFPVQLGSLQIQCFRSPEKEARILDLVRGDTRFMQGYSAPDDQGNNVRVLDLIRGKRLDVVVEDLETDYQTYFFEFLPNILEKFIGSCEAIAFLHDNDERHGDIRRDHLWQEYNTGAYRWIDFDYAYRTHENPFGFDLFGLGHILIFLVGKGVHTSQHLAAQQNAGLANTSFSSSDFALLFPNRLVNLQKLFPAIPDQLNYVLRHFSAGAEIFYETVQEFLDDLAPCVDLVRKG